MSSDCDGLDGREESATSPLQNKKTLKESWNSLQLTKLPPITPSCKLKNENREAARLWRKKKLLGRSKQSYEKSLVEKNGVEARKIEDKHNPTKEIIPMRKRALPESFWHEPNTIKTSSLAGSFYSTLPPLFSDDSKNEGLADIYPVTLPEESSFEQRTEGSCHMSSQPDTDLLFSLFDQFEKKFDEKRLVRRGRPKKLIIEKSCPKIIAKLDDDPCMVDSLSEKLFPQLSLGGEAPTNLTPKFAVLKLPTGERTVELPAINQEKNYSTMLSELVSHM